MDYDFEKQDAPAKGPRGAQTRKCAGGGWGCKREKSGGEGMHATRRETLFVVIISGLKSHAVFSSPNRAPFRRKPRRAHQEVGSRYAAQVSSGSGSSQPGMNVTVPRRRPR